LQQRKWPVELTEAMGREAVARGNVSEVWREVNAGRFLDFPATPVPQSSARAYAEKERKRLARDEKKRAREEDPWKRSHRGTIAQKVDRAAHRMVDLCSDRIQELEHEDGFKAAELKDIATILQTLRRSAPDARQPTGNGAQAAEPQEPEDPLALAVRRAG
jgi:hypothetical protein